MHNNSLIRFSKEYFLHASKWPIMTWYITTAPWQTVTAKTTDNDSFIWFSNEYFMLRNKRYKLLGYITTAPLRQTVTATTTNNDSFIWFSKEWVLHALKRTIQTILLGCIMIAPWQSQWRPATSAGWYNSFIRFSNEYFMLETNDTNDTSGVLMTASSGFLHASKWLIQMTGYITTAPWQQMVTATTTGNDSFIQFSKERVLHASKRTIQMILLGCITIAPWQSQWWPAMSAGWYDSFIWFSKERVLHASKRMIQTILLGCIMIAPWESQWRPATSAGWYNSFIRFSNEYFMLETNNTNDTSGVHNNSSMTNRQWVFHASGLHNEWYFQWQ